MNPGIESLLTENLDLFEKRAFAQLATLMADGSPQVSPVWVDFQDGFVLVNSAVGRLKDRNIRRDPRVVLMGEEVGIYQGAYKVSKGLLQEFGEKRIIDTPITEEGFAALERAVRQFSLTGQPATSSLGEWQRRMRQETQACDVAAAVRELERHRFGQARSTLAALQQGFLQALARGHPRQ